MSTSRRQTTVITLMALAFIFVHVTKGEEVKHQYELMPDLEIGKVQNISYVTQRGLEENKFDYYIQMKEMLDIKVEIASWKSDLPRDRLIRRLCRRLVKHANKTQADHMKVIKAFVHEKNIESFWITNSIHIKDLTKSQLDEIYDQLVKEDLFKEDEKLDYTIYFPRHEDITPNTPLVRTKPLRTKSHRIDQEITELTGANEVWDQGVTGKNVIVGIISSGVDASNPLIEASFLKGNGWYDPVGRSEKPTDYRGIGTAKIALISGANGIGVAPDAKWVGCAVGKFLDVYAIIKCAQFMLCPTDPFGENPDCTKTPHVINNSYGSSFLGKAMMKMEQAIVNVWRATGIIPVFSAADIEGDVGSISNSNNVITVGCVDLEDNVIRSESSRVNTMSLEDKHVKPDFVAVGLFPFKKFVHKRKDNEKPYLMRAVNNGITYFYNTETWKNPVSKLPEGYSLQAVEEIVFSKGSSYAAPRVSGIIALLLSSDLTLTYEEIYEALKITNEPNHVTGYGIVNAPKALKKVESKWWWLDKDLTENDLKGTMEDNFSWEKVPNSRPRKKTKTDEDTE